MALLEELAKQQAANDVVIKKVQGLLKKPSPQAENTRPLEARASPKQGVRVRQVVEKPVTEPKAAPKSQKPHDSGGPIALNASEWTKPVKLVSKAAVLKAVEQGNDIEGNVTVVKSEAEARELKALWNAATRYDPLTVLLPVAGCSSLGGYSAKVSLKRGAAPFALQDSTVVVLGDTHAAAWARQASKVEVAKFAPPAKVTIRITAPYHYRIMFRNDDRWDKITDVLSEIGKWKVCQVSQLTGGTWKWSSTNGGHQLVGHVRVHQSLADALVRKSGEKGIIITQTQVTDRPSESIRWIPKGEQDDETYFRSVVAAAAAKGQGLKYRIGKGSDLGRASRSHCAGSRGSEGLGRL